MAKTSIAEKIKLLHAKSQGTDSEAESLAFSEKVQKMLAEHNLDESILEQEVESRLRELTHTSVDTNQWRIYLYAAAANLYFCDIYINNHREAVNGKWVRRKAIVFVGKEHNAEIALSMSQYLEKTVLRLAKEYSRERRLRLQFEKGAGCVCPSVFGI